jgi:hypothetical protein
VEGVRKFGPVSFGAEKYYLESGDGARTNAERFMSVWKTPIVLGLTTCAALRLSKPLVPSLSTVYDTSESCGKLCVDGATNAIEQNH